MPILDLFRLDGKVALVTGAASGLGAAIATALAEAGAQVAVHGNRRAADETAAAIGKQAAAFQADLSHTSGAESLFNSVHDRFGRIDILINNAGTIHRDAAVDTSLESWQQVMQVNLTSVFQLSQLFARNVFARSSASGNGTSAGKIVNIASLLSFQGGIRVPAYASSKGGVAQLTKALANEWAPRGIQVNAIAPGYFATTNTEALQADESRNRQILERIPAARWGQPQDLAGAALYLSSAASDYVTGTVLTVDGGWMGEIETSTQAMQSGLQEIHLQQVSMMNDQQMAEVTLVEGGGVYTDADGQTHFIKGYGFVRGNQKLDLDPRIDLTAPIWEQVQKLREQDAATEKQGIGFRVAGVLLDTHALLWLGTPSPMSVEAIRTVDRASQANSLFVSPISAWELGVASRKKIPLDVQNYWASRLKNFFIQATAKLNIQPAPISAEIGLESSALLNLYDCADPGDCLIMATAHVLQLTLVTRDRRILDFARQNPSYLTSVAC